MKSEDARCGICGCVTRGRWTGKFGDALPTTVALCGDCVHEMIEDYGQEFPEETFDDLPPDDLDEV